MNVLILGLNIEDPNLYGLDFEIYSEIWTLNDFYRFYRNIAITKVFQLHRNIDDDLAKLQKNFPSRWVDWIKEYNRNSATKVVFDIDNRLDGWLQIYPLEIVLKRFSNFKFVNSFSYILAFAYLSGVRKLTLRGFSDNIGYSDSLYSNKDLLLDLELNNIKIDCLMWDEIKLLNIEYNNTNIKDGYGL